MYLYAEDLSELKYEFLIKKHENVGIKYFNYPNGFTECSNTMDDAYENINDYNPSRKRKTLIGFDDMIADIMSDKKFQARVKDLFIRCRKLNISLVFITHLIFLSQKTSDKFDTLFDYENKQQKRINQSFCRLIILQLIIL